MWSTVPVRLDRLHHAGCKSLPVTKLLTAVVHVIGGGATAYLEV